MNDDSFPCAPLETHDAVSLCERADVALDPEVVSYARVQAVHHRVLLLEIDDDEATESGYRGLPATRRVLVGTLDVLRARYDVNESLDAVRWLEGHTPEWLSERVRATFAAAGLAPRAVTRWAEEDVAEIRATPQYTCSSIFVGTSPPRPLAPWHDASPALGALDSVVQFVTGSALAALMFVAMEVARDHDRIITVVAPPLMFLAARGIAWLYRSLSERHSPRGRRFAGAAARTA